MFRVFYIFTIYLSIIFASYMGWNIGWSSFDYSVTYIFIAIFIVVLIVEFYIVLVIESIYKKFNEEGKTQVWIF